MSIEVSVTLYGPQIMRELAAEPEELYYGLLELSENSTPGAVAESLSDRIEPEDDILIWLEDLVAALKNPSGA